MFLRTGCRICLGLTSATGTVFPLADIVGLCMVTELELETPVNYSQHRPNPKAVLPCLPPPNFSISVELVNICMPMKNVKLESTN